MLVVEFEPENSLSKISIAVLPICRMGWLMVVSGGLV
jgi:hypothetical protein